MYSLDNIEPSFIVVIIPSVFDFWLVENFQPKTVAVQVRYIKIACNSELHLSGKHLSGKHFILL